MLLYLLFSAESMRQRLYNEGDECYCGYMMRIAGSDRSLILSGSTVLSVVSFLIVLVLRLVY